MMETSFSEYNREQLVTIRALSEFLGGLNLETKKAIRVKISPYLSFRKRSADFHNNHFVKTCTERCFKDHSAHCCGKEGIIVFFSDMFINLIEHPDLDLEGIITQLERGDNEKCVYLGPQGCLWPVKPVVCEMYICDRAKAEVLKKGEPKELDWNGLLELEKEFTKPDKPVLFDYLEAIFLEAGYQSPLTYFHKSPGLLRLKLNSGLITDEQYYQLSGRKRKKKKTR